MKFEYSVNRYFLPFLGKRRVLSVYGQTDEIVIFAVFNKNDIGIFWPLTHPEAKLFLEMAKSALDGSRQTFSSYTDAGPILDVRMVRRGDMKVDFLWFVPDNRTEGYLISPMDSFEVELSIPMDKWEELLNGLTDWVYPTVTHTDLELIP